MLVDDVEISNFIMKKMISKVSGDYEIVDYTFPELALAELADHNPDIIFLDLNMPMINGWEFLAHLQENNLKYKIYILTSSTSQLDVQKSKNYENVKGFLVKPINITELADILQTVL